MVAIYKYVDAVSVPEEHDNEDSHSLHMADAATI